MNILCLSRAEIETQTFSEPHIKIVIHDPDLDRPNTLPCKNCLDILYLSFDDISYESEVDAPFSKYHADKVIKILNKNKRSIRSIIVSCEKGVSRSAGLGTALDEFFNKKESDLFYRSDKYPNMLVYKIMKSNLEGAGAEL